VPWQVERSSRSAVTLTREIDRERWPFGGVVRQQVSLEPDSLLMSAEVTAGEAMPASLGWHPWFLYRNGTVRLRLESAQTLETTEDLIPTGREVPVDGLTDLRAGADLTARTLDHTYTRAVGPAVSSPSGSARVPPGSPLRGRAGRGRLPQGLLQPPRPGGAPRLASPTGRPGAHVSRPPGRCPPGWRPGRTRGRRACVVESTSAARERCPRLDRTRGPQEAIAMEPVHALNSRSTIAA